MANQLLDARTYTEQGLSRLSKEKLVTIISNLQNMPTEVAMKVVEHIPGYFEICKEDLQNIVSLHKDDEERSDKNVQRVFDGLDSRRKILEKFLNEAETVELRDKYMRDLEKLDKEAEEIRVKTEAERKDGQKRFFKAMVVITCVAAAGIGVTIKMGKIK